MRLSDAIETVFDSALQKHKWECACVENGKITNTQKCDCGATDHNKLILDSVIRMLNRKDEPLDKIVQRDVGVESPLWKFEDQC